MRGFVGENIQQKVRIIPWKEYPFKVLSSRTQYGKNIRFKFKESKKWKGIEYQVMIENLKTDKGSYADTIILQTDSEIKPEIRIPVYGRILLKQQQKAD
ncbi:MAG: hypothetical protein MUP22_13750 [Desulfobacterales bacterium]|nr:hypothetical protein [Desulfobacterales bacterium]